MNDNVNVPLLRKALEWAEADAELDEDKRTWNQEVWASGEIGPLLPGGRYYEVPVTCGTSFCLAGWICQAAGDTFVIQLPSSDAAIYAAEETVVGVTQVLTTDGRVMFADNRAAELLGVSGPNTVCEDLFDGDNDIEDLRRFAEELAGEKL